MANGDRQVAPTPSALLELKEERQVVREGYDFLDEKRLLLAGEILEQVQRYEALVAEYRETLERARQAMAAALAVHGLDGLQVQPPASLDDASVHVERQSFLGVTTTSTSLRDGDPTPVNEPVRASPETREVCERFQRLLARSAELAGVSGNLHRLMAEYRRTERRARALEDVLMPELDQAIEQTRARLEEIEQEEAVRVRLAPSRGS